MFQTVLSERFTHRAPDLPVEMTLNVMPFSSDRPFWPCMSFMLSRQTIWSPDPTSSPSRSWNSLSGSLSLFALRAPFEDEPFVDVAYLRVRSGDQQCRLAHRLPFDAHLVRVFLHVRVLAPVDAVMRQIFVHELPALVDARFVQPVAAVA